MPNFLTWTFVGFLLLGCGLQDPILFRSGGGTSYGIFMLGGGGASTTTLHKSAFDDGTAALAGITTGNLGGNSYGSTGNDFYLAAIGPTLIASAIAQAGGASGTVRGVARDAQQNIYVLYLGKYPGATLRTSTSCTIRNLGLAKFNASGQLLWASEFGASNVASMSSGSLFVTGTSVYPMGQANAGSNIDYGFSQTGGAGIYQAFVTRVDPETGAVTWGRQFSPGGLNSLITNPLSLGSNSDLLISGGASGTLGGAVAGSGGAARLFVASLSLADGTVNWIREQTGSASGYSPRPLYVEDGGNLYLLGTLQNTTAANVGATLVGGNSTVESAVLVKYDSAGTRQWAVVVSGGGASTTSGILGSSPTGTLFYGTSNGTLGGVQIGTAGGVQCVVVPVAANGTVSYTVQVGAGVGTNCSVVDAALFSGGGVLLANTSASVSGLNNTGTLGASENALGLAFDAST